MGKNCCWDGNEQGCGFDGHWQPSREYEVKYGRDKVCVPLTEKDNHGH